MKGGNGTHWEDCYKSHIDCAEVLIDKQKRHIAALESALKEAARVIDCWCFDYYNNSTHGSCQECGFAGNSEEHIQRCFVGKAREAIRKLLPEQIAALKGKEGE